jgi:hypothetical protein
MFRNLVIILTILALYSLLNFDIILNLKIKDLYKIPELPLRNLLNVVPEITQITDNIKRTFIPEKQNIPKRVPPKKVPVNNQLELTYINTNSPIKKDNLRIPTYNNINTFTHNAVKVKK